MARRVLKEFRWGVLPIPGRVLAILFFLFLFILPLITDSDYMIHLATIAAIFTIFAVSWDLLSGYVGQVNFGHALFFGAGAYGTALLGKHLGWPVWATIPLGALMATALGVVTCFPALRLRPPYLSLLTLAFPVILGRIVRSLPRGWAGADFGIRDIPRLSFSADAQYYICLIAMTVCVLIMWKLTDAGSRYVRTGLIFHAIREDEIAARATGINTIRYKILAFAIGGFFAGLAGALWAHYGVGGGFPQGAVHGLFAATMSFQVIVWVVFGGIASIYGSVVGVYTLYFLGDTLRLTPLGIYRLLIVVIIIVAILLFMPGGVAVSIRDKIERRCPRCKVTNVAWRKECRACTASLR